jgi:hypothetical protein
MVAAMSEVSTRRNGVPAEVHASLTIWGNYMRRNRLGGPNGYPRESPFVKASLYGKLGIPQETNVRANVDAEPPVVTQMEAIVQKMPQDLAEVVVMRYRPPLNDYGNEPPFETMAKMLSMSSSTFRSRLESAQWYVFARMYP